MAGLVSSTVAIPLAMAFGMFAFVSLGDEYFAYGAMAGLISAVIAGAVSVALGDRSTRIYALLDRGPRSATVTAEEDIEGFGLSETSFAELCRQHPDIAIKLLQALGRELSVRIRHANMTIQ